MNEYFGDFADLRGGKKISRIQLNPTIKVDDEALWEYLTNWNGQSFAQDTLTNFVLESFMRFNELGNKRKFKHIVIQHKHLSVTVRNDLADLREKIFTLEKRIEELEGK